MASLKPEDVAQEFVNTYYHIFDGGNRKALGVLYRKESKMNFGVKAPTVEGVDEIGEKLISLPFEKVKHNIEDMVVQVGPDSALLIFVTGALMVDEEPRPMNYTQVFLLKHDGASFYVHNDIFRLI